MARRSKDRTPKYATKEEEDLRQQRREIKEERNRKAIEKATSKTSRQPTTPQKLQTPPTKTESSRTSIIPPPLDKAIPKSNAKAHHSAVGPTPGTVAYHPSFPKPAQWFHDSIILEDLCNTRYHLRSSDIIHHTSHFSRQADTPTLISRWEPTHTIPIFKVPLESDIVTIILISISPYSGSGTVTSGDIVPVMAASKEVAEEWGILNFPSSLWRSASQLNGTPDQLAAIAWRACRHVDPRIPRSTTRCSPSFGQVQAGEESRLASVRLLRPRNRSKTRGRNSSRIRLQCQRLRLLQRPIS